MRKFSEEISTDRQFEIGGEVFTYRIFGWDETVTMLDTKLDESLVINEDGSYSFRADTEWCIKEIPNFLEPGDDRERFKKLMARKTAVVPRHQIAELYGWLRQRVQNLPTTPPSPMPSADGGGSNGAESSVGSPSTEAPSKA